MRKLVGLVVVPFVVTLALPAFAATETVTGRLIDQACYVKDHEHNADNDHKMPRDVEGCAVTCAKRGQPVALLTEDGKVVTVTGELAADNNAKLVPHMGHVVKVTGDITMKDDSTTIAASELTHVSE